MRQRHPIYYLPLFVVLLVMLLVVVRPAFTQVNNPKKQTANSCGANQYATGINSDGTLTCATVSYGQVGSTPTLPVTTTATTSQYFTAYNATTGAFTKGTVSYTDINGTLAHSSLSGIGTNSHTQIDAAIAASTAHIAAETGIHGATSLATAGKIVQRDTDGGFDIDTTATGRNGLNILSDGSAGGTLPDNTAFGLNARASGPNDNAIEGDCFPDDQTQFCFGVFAFSKSQGGVGVYGAIAPTDVQNPTGLYSWGMFAGNYNNYGGGSFLTNNRKDDGTPDTEEVLPTYPVGAYVRTSKSDAIGLVVQSNRAGGGKLISGVDSTETEHFSVTSAGTVTAASFVGPLTGNADTATNGVVTSGSYSNPAWITALAGSKITGNISGNAATASALDHNPTACASGRFVTDLDAVAALSCGQVAYADVSGTPTLAATKTSVASQWLKSYDSSTGAFTSTQPLYSEISGTPTLAATKASVASQWLKSYDSSTGLFTATQPAYTEISGTPTLAANTTATTSQWFRAYDSSTGAFTKSQPAFTDISGSVTDAQVPDGITVTLSATATALAADPTDCSGNNFALGINASGTAQCAQPAFTNISGTVAATQLPNPSATTLGGIQSKAAVTSNFLTSISTLGVPSSAQPAFSDISGSVTDAQVPDTITVNLAAAATALNANGTNCSAGSYARGVDASGNAENCTADSVGGDASTNTSTSVDGEVALFSGTAGKTLKRSTLTAGVTKYASGVPSLAAYSDVVALFASGSCSGFLKSDGTCNTPSGGGDVVTNPSGTQTIQPTADGTSTFTQYNGTNALDIFRVRTKTPTTVFAVDKDGVTNIGTGAAGDLKVATGACPAGEASYSTYCSDTGDIPSVRRGTGSIIALADVSTAQSLTNKKLGSLTTNGFVKTSSSDGTLSVDTTTYADLSSAQSLTNKKLGSLTTNGLVSVSAGDGTLSSAATATEAQLPAANKMRFLRVTGSDYTNSANPAAFSDITGLTTAVASADVVSFECDLIVDAAATTTGTQFGINSGATTSYIRLEVFYMTSATAVATYGVTTFDATSAAQGTFPVSSAGTTLMTVKLIGHVVFTSSGTFAIRGKSEVNSSNITVYRGSSCRIFGATA